MVAPSNGWEDTEDGYRNGETTLAVHEVSVRWSRGGSLKSGEGYGVNIYYGYDSHRFIAAFSDARTAWEFANLLTHYIDRRGTIESAIAELTNEMGGPGTRELDRWEPPALIEDISAVEVLRKMAGSYRFVVDEICEEMGLAGGSE